MTEVRPVESTPEQLGQLARDFEDFKATVMARLVRRSTGDIEPTLRKTAKPGTLLLNGQTVNRADYPDLWAWVQANGLVMSGLFTSGNGSTTFGLPNFSGRVLIGVGTLGSDTYTLGQLVGEARVTLTQAQMPSHTHSGSTSTESHSHSGSTSSGGSHDGHNFTGITQGWFEGVQWPYGHEFAGEHSHSLNINSSSHSHSMNLNSTGGGQAHENRQPSIAVNWLIWT